MNKFMVFLNRKIIIPVSFRIVIPGILILFIPPIAYIIWEIYWYEKFGLGFIKWHTHLAPYIFIGLACVFLYQSLNRKHRSKLIANTFLAMGSVIFAGFIAETFLIISGVTKTSQEESEGYYVSPYRNAPSYYLRWSPGRPHEMKSNEFSHIRNTNSLGFSDEEWRIEKKTKEKRVLALGDSFTEGMGASTDSSYVSILRRELGDPYYVMNGGVCGSDPFNNYINLKDLLLKYKPDIIIQSLSSQDVLDDIMLRGGMERFQKDGTMRSKPAPWWEPLYAINYTLRVILTVAGYRETLQNVNFTLAEIKSINESLISLFAQYSALCQKNGIRLFIVLHPQKREVQLNKYEYDFSPIFQSIATTNRTKVIDLLPLYLSYIKNDRSNVTEYFWKQDGHHNSKGYKMMAETTWQNIAPLIRDSTIGR